MQGNVASIGVKNYRKKVSESLLKAVDNSDTPNFFDTTVKGNLPQLS